MKLEVTDIVHQEFKRTFRGYDEHEVAAFLEVVAENYTELSNANTALLLKIKLAENEMEQLKLKLNENEKTIQSYKQEMVKIERLMDSKIDADFIIQKARSDAERFIADAKNQADRIASETTLLLEQRAKVAAHLREYLKSQMALLGIIANTDEIHDLNIPDSTLIQEVPNENDSVDVSPAMETNLEDSGEISLERTAEEGIDSFLSDVQLDDIPQELAHALSRYKENDEPRIVDPIEEAKKQHMLDDLDLISEHATGMFKKADFHKMLGDDIHTRSEEMINQIYAELEKKKSLQKDNSKPEEKK